MKRSHAALALAVILSGSISSCGPGNPETYGECLVDLGRTRTADDAEFLCRQAFPEPPTPEPVVPFYVGDFFYRAAGLQCATISFQGTGRINPLNTGYCGEGSRIECDPIGCRFTCRNYNRSDSSVVSVVRENLAGISILSTDSSTFP